VVSKGHGPTHPASYSGDEAFLAAKNFPKAIVVVGKDRRKSALAASRLGAKMIVLDDALQHRRIARDKEVIVMDMNDPYGLGHFLPRGLLREGISALSRADLIILNHTQDHSAFEKFKIELSHHTSAPVVGTKVEVTGAYTVNSGESVSLDGKKAAVFCGIAHPDYFVKTVEGMGAKVVCEHFMPDHDPFSLDRLIDFSREATKLGAEFLVCTEKDQVKMGSVPEGILPVVWIKMRLTVTEGKKAWTDFIEQGKELLRSQI
jgi:tetraacyldisaccharide 4'-kinase